MFLCHVWGAVDRLTFQGKVSSVIVPSAKGPTKIMTGYCPIVLGLVDGVVRLDCEDGTQKKIHISGGAVSVSEDQIVILPKVFLDPS